MNDENTRFWTGYIIGLLVGTALMAPALVIALMTLNSAYSYCH